MQYHCVLADCRNTWLRQAWREKKQLGFNLALSGEGVPSLRSVLATGLVSRDAQEFGISQACRL